MTTPAATTARLLRLLSLLQARRDWPGPLLAERLDVSARTVRRDVERLRDLGYAIDATRGTDGGYRLDAGAELPPLLLDDDQVTAVAVALQAAPLLGTDVDDAAERALATIRRVMPERLRRRADDVRFVPLPDASPTPSTTDALTLLTAAVRRHEVVRFDHDAPGADPDAPSGPPRRVEPHHVVATRGRWYLVAWDLDRDDWRLFRVDRLRLRAHTGGRFTPRPVPGGDVRAFVAARFRGTAPGATPDATGPGGPAEASPARTPAAPRGAAGWPCTGTAVLRAPARAVAPFVDDGTVEDLGDGRCRVTLGAWSWVALAALLGRFDTDVEDVAPRALADACATLAARYAAAARRSADLP
ncbi:helix-turn-helix transcriptional regulator [Cellulomonas sp. FA1]|uniref:helix-turn-helix transcriptional regulator n=1 Tax=Cellulomonas sp. FA1 TaxID=1346710 RepID=UPI000626C855|nr:WYL domain-containing protein [Cellulomonas sp. FA1]